MKNHTIEMGTWSRALFPSSGMREEFVSHVRLWNLLEDLPRIELEMLRDGVSIKFRTEDGELRGLNRLIDSLGGHLTFHLRGALPGAGVPSTL